MGYIGAGPTRFNTADELTVTGDAEFNGNLTVKGTTTTIDSVTVQNFDMGDNDKIRLGDSQDLVITHDGTDSIINEAGTGSLKFQYGGTDGVVFDSSGNVGIGASSPVAKLDVIVGTDERLLFTHNSGTSLISSVNAANTAYNELYLNGSDIRFGTSLSEKMRIDSTGNVGIGCTPDSALEIRTATNSSSDTTYLKLSNLGENVGHIDFENGNGNLARITGTKLGSGASANDGILTFSTAFDAVLSERMRINSVGNVGIGTSSPAQPLHVVGGAVQFQNTQSTYLQVNTGDTHLYTAGSHPLRFGTNSAERMRITAAGGIEIPNQNAINELTFTGGDFTNVFSNTTSGFQLGTTAASYLSLLTNNTERLYIDSSGRVLIGATVHSISSLQKFEVQGGIAAFILNDNASAPVIIKNTNSVAGNGVPHIVLQDSSGNRGGIYRNSSSEIGLHGQGALTFHTGGTAPTTERMRLDSNGNVGIGTNNPATNKLRVVADNPTNYTNAQFEILSNAGNVIQSFHAGGQTAVLWKHPRGSQVLEARNNPDTGYIGINASAFTVSSDYRLKENIVPISDATERLKKLNPVRFNFKPFEETGVEHHNNTVDGFLAHEVSHDSDGNPLVPEAITGEKDGMREEQYVVTPAVEATYDDDGNILTEAVPAVMGTRSVPDWQGIDQAKLVPLLVKTIQELEARIAALETA